MKTNPTASVRTAFLLEFLVLVAPPFQPPASVISLQARTPRRLTPEALAATCPPLHPTAKTSCSCSLRTRECGRDAGGAEAKLSSAVEFS